MEDKTKTDDNGSVPANSAGPSTLNNRSTKRTSDVFKPSKKHKSDSTSGNVGNTTINEDEPLIQVRNVENLHEDEAASLISGTRELTLSSRYSTNPRPSNSREANKNIESDLEPIAIPERSRSSCSYNTSALTHARESPYSSEHSRTHYNLNRSDLTTDRESQTQSQSIVIDIPVDLNSLHIRDIYRIMIIKLILQFIFEDP